MRVTGVYLVVMFGLIRADFTLFWAVFWCSGYVTFAFEGGCFGYLRVFRLQRLAWGSWVLFASRVCMLLVLCLAVLFGLGAWFCFVLGRVFAALGV